MLNVCHADDGWSSNYYTMNNVIKEYFEHGFAGFKLCEAARQKSCMDEPKKYSCMDGIVTCVKAQGLWSYRINDWHLTYWGTKAECLEARTNMCQSLLLMKCETPSPGRHSSGGGFWSGFVDGLKKPYEAVYNLDDDDGVPCGCKNGCDSDGNCNFKNGVSE